MEKIKVVVYGVGVVGSGMVRMIANKDWIEIVGAIDIDKAKVGRDLGEVAGIRRKLGIVISDKPEAVFSRKRANVILHATSFTTTEKLEAQVLRAIETGANVISTTDSKLSYPWLHWPELGRRIDKAAKKKRVTFLYTGVNPSFAMNFMPLASTGICASIKKISMKRIVDLAPYGEGVLKVLGVGRTIDDFYRGVKDGSIGGTVPLIAPQIDMITDIIGWQIKQKRTVEHIISKNPKKTSYGTVVEPGIVCGSKWIYHGKKGKEEVVAFEFIEAINASEEGLDPGNYISIVGEPNVDLFFKESRADIATSAALVNAIPQVIEAKPGLLTVRDLPVATMLKRSYH